MIQNFNYPRQPPPQNPAYPNVGPPRNPLSRNPSVSEPEPQQVPLAQPRNVVFLPVQQQIPQQQQFVYVQQRAPTFQHQFQSGVPFYQTPPQFVGTRFAQAYAPMPGMQAASLPVLDLGHNPGAQLTKLDNNLYSINVPNNPAGPSHQVNYSQQSNQGGGYIVSDGGASYYAQQQPHVQYAGQVQNLQQAPQYQTAPPAALAPPAGRMPGVIRQAAPIQGTMQMPQIEQQQALPPQLPMSSAQSVHSKPYRAKKILTLVDPNTHENVMADVQREQEELARQQQEQIANANSDSRPESVETITENEPPPVPTVSAATTQNQPPGDPYPENDNSEKARVYRELQQKINASMANEVPPHAAPEEINELELAQQQDFVPPAEPKARPAPTDSSSQGQPYQPGPGGKPPPAGRTGATVTTVTAGDHGGKVGRRGTSESEQTHETTSHVRPGPTPYSSQDVRASQQQQGQRPPPTSKVVQNRETSSLPQDPKHQQAPSVVKAKPIAPTSSGISFGFFDDAEDATAADTVSGAHPVNSLDAAVSPGAMPKQQIPSAGISKKASPVPPDSGVPLKSPVPNQAATRPAGKAPQISPARVDQIATNSKPPEVMSVDFAPPSTSVSFAAAVDGGKVSPSPKLPSTLSLSSEHVKEKPTVPSVEESKAIIANGAIASGDGKPVSSSQEQISVDTIAGAASRQTPEGTSEAIGEAAASLLSPTSEDSAGSRTPVVELTPPLEDVQTEEPMDVEAPLSQFDIAIDRLNGFYQAGVFHPESGIGLKVYGRDFMTLAERLPMALLPPTLDVNCPAELKCPQRCTINHEPPKEKQQMPYNTPRKQPVPGQSFQPDWLNAGPGQRDGGPQFYGGRSSQQRGYQGRSSGQHQRQQQKKSQVVIRPSLSTQDIKLHTAGENAWKPTVKSGAEVDETAALYKRVRGILNKITPQMFNDLLAEYLELNINDDEHLQGVIDIFFDKTVEEPKYCSMYADFCSTVCTDQLKKSDNKSQFRNFLLTKCQKEFQREKNFETLQAEKEAEIEAAESEAKRKELQDSLNELLLKEKRRMLGTMTFIGELYKRQMLTIKIMIHCIQQLLSKLADEESLECLCKLMTTIGQQLDREKLVDYKRVVEHCYAQLEKEMPGLPARLRFMIRDLLELRLTNWELRPKDKGAGPMTISDLHRSIEAEKYQRELEQHTYEQNVRQQQQQQHGGYQQQGSRQSYGDGYGGRGSQTGPRQRQAAQGPRFNENFDERGGGGKNRYGGSGPSQERGGAKYGGNQGKRGDAQQAAKVVEQLPAKGSLLKHQQQNAEEMCLRPGGGAKFRPAMPPAKNKPQPEEFKTRNRFTELDGAREGSVPSSRDSSQTRVEARGGSLAASEKPSSLQPTPSQSRDPSPSQESRKASVEEQQAFEPKKFCELLTDEFSSGDVNEAKRLLSENRRHLDKMIPCLFDIAVEKKDKDRLCISKIFDAIVDSQLCSFDDFLQICGNFVSDSIQGDLECDCPALWQFTAVLLAPTIERHLRQLSSVGVHLLSKAEDGYVQHKLICEILLAVINKHPEGDQRDIAKAALVDAWRCSNLNDMSEELQSMLTEKGLSDFTSSANSASCIPSSASASLDSVSLQQSCIDVAMFVRSHTPTADDLLSWLEQNVPSHSRSNAEFVRAFSTAVCSSAVGKTGVLLLFIAVYLIQDLEDGQVNEKAVADYCKCLLFVVDAVPELEAAVLDSVCDITKKAGCRGTTLMKLIYRLLMSNVITYEGLSDWWQTINARNSADDGMILANREVKKFMSDNKPHAPQSSEPLRSASPGNLAHSSVAESVAPPPSSDASSSGAAPVPPGDEADAKKSSSTDERSSPTSAHSA